MQVPLTVGSHRDWTGVQRPMTKAMLMTVMTTNTPMQTAKIHFQILPIPMRIRRRDREILTNIMIHKERHT